MNNSAPFTNTTTVKPKIELLLGPAACGKTQALLQHIQRGRERRSLVLVPGATQYQQLRAQFGRPRGVYLAQFLGLARRPLRRAGMLPRLLDDVGRITLVRHALRDLLEANQLPTYQRVALKPGFIASVAELIDDLGNADVDAEKFAAKAQTPHDAELAAIYRRYQDLQELHGVADVPRNLRLACDLIDQQPDLIRGYDLLAVDGFDQFSPLQLRLLSAFARHIPRVVVTLTGTNVARPAHRRFARTRAELHRHFVVHESLVDTSGPCHAVLQHAANHFFEIDTPEPISAGNRVALIEAADREREVRAVLRRVKRLLLEGVPASSIAVIFRDGSAYTRLLREVAVEFAVPLMVEEGHPLTEAPPIAALLALLRTSPNDYQRRALVEMLRSPYLNISGGTLPTADAPVDQPRRSLAALAEQLDALARQVGVAGGLARWRAALAHKQITPEVEHEHAHLSLSDDFEQFIAWITPLSTALPHDYIAWTRERLVNIRQAALGAESATLLFHTRDQAALDRFSLLLDQLDHAANLTQAEPIPYSTFVTELESFAAATRFAVPKGGVIVRSVLAARGTTFDHVFLLGLSEGEFPQPLSEPAIYSRSERQAWQERGIPLSARDAADEVTLFYEAITRARHTLTLSRTRLDEAGSSLARSPYLNNLLSLLTDITIERVRAGSVPSWEEAASPQEQALALAEALKRPADRVTHDDTLLWHTELLDVYPVWAHVIQARQIEEQREQAVAFGPYDGILDDPSVIAQVAQYFGPEHQWSITQLNNYVTCPFRFAASHLLCIRPRHEPEDEIDSARRGQLLHAIFSRAGKAWQQAQLRLTPENEPHLQQQLEQAATAVLTHAPEQLGFAPSPFWEWEQSEIRRVVRTALRGFVQLGESWSAFAPIAFEQGFGGNSSYPPLLLETDAGTVHVQGRIDRIDQRDDGALAIVDYKSSRTPRPLSESVEGYDLQLAVYTMALEQHSAQPVERAAFMHMGSGKRGAEIAQAHRDTALQAARERIVEVVTLVRSGDFRVKPRRQCPTYCEFEVLCRKNLDKA